jgi:lipoprotein-anchoring transpeptidase ErfK/SrfK
MGLWHGRLVRIAVVALAPCVGLLSLLLTGCADHDHAVVISVPEQRMVVLERGVPLAVYPVSTSKFGLGDVPGRGLTPLGELEIADKIGDGAPPGAVIKSRQRTGEIVAIDAPGRDAIVTRILWLRGMEGGNRNAYGRYIYIHGTPEERNIGRPVSYGCVRMRSRDIIALYDTVGRGARVVIEDEPLAEATQPLLAPGAAIPVAPPDGPGSVAVAGPTSQGH